MSPGPSPERTPTDAEARHQHWQRRLRRIRLGAEPVEEQVERLRRVTWGVTVVAGLIGGMIVVLFSAFRAPMAGLALGGALAAPIIGLAWWTFAATRRVADAYLRERDAIEADRPGPAPRR